MRQPVVKHERTLTGFVPLFEIQGLSRCGEPCIKVIPLKMKKNAITRWGCHACYSECFFLLSSMHGLKVATSSVVMQFEVCDVQ